jgi:hypothetical protein
VGQGGGVDVVRARGAQGRRARVQGRTGRQDIVQDDVAPVGVEGPAWRQSEGPSDIGPTFLTIEAGLREGFVGFDQKRGEGAAWQARREPGGDSLGLIISPFPLSPGMQRHRHKDRTHEVTPKERIRQRHLG